MNPDNSEYRVLSSWKEIAACLGRGVRTVQRWEKVGLPVRRPYGEGVNVVMAIEWELHEWMSSRQKRDASTTDLNQRLLHLKKDLRRIGSNIEILDLRLKSDIRGLADKEQSSESAKVISVLAVDDNDLHRYTIGKLLSASGFEARLAKCGVEALCLAAESKPDVILLDVILPDVSGFDVCTSLRSDDSTKDIPVIFHTALAANEVNCSRAIASGACAFITYPIDRNDLVTLINTCLVRATA